MTLPDLGGSCHLEAARRLEQVKDKLFQTTQLRKRHFKLVAL